MASNNILPAYTKGENLLSLIEVLKKNSKNEESIKAMFNLGKSAYENTRSALRTFEIIEKDGFEFTAIGREIAYSDDENKKQEFIKIVKRYEPYKLILDSLEISRDDTKMTDIDTIKNLWGKAGFGSTDRNRKDGATLFMGLIDFIELGVYKVGRGGNNPTRIEWIADIKNKINGLFEENSQNEVQNVANIIEKDEEPIEVGNEEINSASPIINIKECTNEKLNKQQGIMNFPNITINVDMEDWSEEKIKAFFKYAYGNFEEE